MTEHILEYLEKAGVVISLFAVAIILVGFAIAAWRYGRRFRKTTQEDNFRLFKVELGSALLLGLEILVAADIIRTVALEATLQSVAVLGLLVLIRTFLSWALVVEIEGRWPWQRGRGYWSTGCGCRPGV